MSIASKFTFVGELIISKPKDASHSNFYSEWKGGSKENIPMRKISFGIKDSPSNSAFVESFGREWDSIRAVDLDGNKVEIPWEDRNTEETLKILPYHKKFIVNLGPDYGDRHEFAAEYDMIKYLAENLKDFKGKLCVTGHWRKDAYKGRFIDKFIIKDVYAVESDRKSKLELSMDFFYTHDSVDTADEKSEKKIYINGYVEQYIDKDTGSQYLPQTAIMSLEKYDMENEIHVKRLKYRRGYLSKLSKKKMSHITWQCRYVNGSEEIEFDESMLTDRQKEQIELGIKTLDDFKPSGGVLGNKKREVRLVDPILKGVYNDGIVECDETMEEFEDKIFKFEEDEKLEDVIKEDILEAAKVEDSESEDDMDDLF
ncbi:hypothetical protein AALA22_13080 [Anaerovoracaceae bacterium 41-7]